MKAKLCFQFLINLKDGEKESFENYLKDKIGAENWVIYLFGCGF